MSKIKYALSREQRSELKQTLKGSNKIMRELVRDSFALMPSRRKANDVMDCKIIRDAAHGVFGALATAPWGCHETHPHRANLRLDRMISGPFDGLAYDKHHMRFRIVFDQKDNCQAHPLCDWREVDIYPLQSRENADWSARSELGYAQSLSREELKAMSSMQRCLIRLDDRPNRFQVELQPSTQEERGDTGSVNTM